MSHATPESRALAALFVATSLFLAVQPSGANAAAPSFAPFGLDLEARDPQVRPGDDFDGFANGHWAANVQIAPDRSTTGLFRQLGDRSLDEQQRILAAAAPDSRVGRFYASFMDEARLEQLDATPIADDLERIAAVRDKTAFATLVGPENLPIGARLLQFDVGSDPDRPRINILRVGQPTLGLPDRDYYLDPKFASNLEAYRDWIVRALTLGGWPAPESSARAVVAYETELARVEWSRVDSRDLDRTRNPMTLAQLARRTPELPWHAMLDGAGIGDPGVLNVRQPGAIDGVARLFATTPLETLKAWAAFHLVNDAAPYLSHRFVDAEFAYSRTLGGEAELAPRWQRAVALLDGALGDDIGREYVARNFSPAAKEQMVRLVTYLKLAMADRIRAATWMSEPTRQQALAKLASMDVMVGYPDQWRDYSGLRVEAGDLLGNVRRSNRFDWAYERAELGRPVDRKRWGMTPQTVNAYNSPRQNQVVFPAAILQPPVFDPNADAAVNYGAVGMVIGHEISHGFDDQGRKIDATGTQRDWWTPDDATRFSAQTTVLGAQFDGYEPLPGARVNGALTMGENVADLAGAHMALDAYHRSLGGARAPVLADLDGDQRFFLSFAQLWRTKQRDDALRRQVQSDPHSPARYRIDGTLRNIDEWYAAFDVRPGDAMYVAPEQRSRVW